MSQFSHPVPTMFCAARVWRVRVFLTRDLCFLWCCRRARLHDHVARLEAGAASTQQPSATATATSAPEATVTAAAVATAVGAPAVETTVAWVRSTLLAPNTIASVAAMQREMKFCQQVLRHPCAAEHIIHGHHAFSILHAASVVYIAPRNIL